MYKKYNFKPDFLSKEQKTSFSDIAEKLLPFLLIAATFTWLWR